MEQNQFMTDEELAIISRYIEKNLGIRMPVSKRVLLEVRLAKRLKDLHFANFHDYFKYLFSEEGQCHELHRFIDVITTHKTNFFREPQHFYYLYEELLPQYKERKEMLKIWSCASSSGEEVYSLIMVIEEFKKNMQCHHLSYRVLGSDISQEMITHAIKATYKEEDVKELSTKLKKSYFLRSKEKEKKLIRIIPELRKNTQFRIINLNNNDFGNIEPMDIIFCRNVLIYFEQEVQKKIMEQVISYLKKGGYLIIGHAESIFSFKLPLKLIKTTIFKKI